MCLAIEIAKKCSDQTNTKNINQPDKDDEECSVSKSASETIIPVAKLVEALRLTAPIGHNLDEQL